jgi:2-polyprenyl-3-methyl-5-hydroxy-6-metoxy-1,4-benzoquinol methylase
MEIGGIHIEENSLSEKDLSELQILLLKSSSSPPTVNDIWQLMDEVWDKLGCDNRNINWEKINGFYKHPIWILNGIFTEYDPASIRNRQAIADWVFLNQNKINSCLDYGGGFGSLSRLVSDKSSEIFIDIYEPHPTTVALSKSEKYYKINYIDTIEKHYDLLISTDVLEHVSNPLKLFSEMIGYVNYEGYIILANCFYPDIKCHLPITFHLRFTFNIFAKMMGLKNLGRCNKTYAFLYQKRSTKIINWKLIRLFERLSQVLFPFLGLAYRGYKLFK